MSLATSTPDSSTTTRTTGEWKPKLDAWNLVTGWAFPFSLIPTILAKHGVSIPSDPDPLFATTTTVIDSLTEKGRGIYDAMDPERMDDGIEIGCNVYTLVDPDEGGMILILYRSSDKGPGPLLLEASGAVDNQGKHFDYLDAAGLRELKDKVYQAVFAKLSDEDQGKVFWGTFQDTYQKSTWDMYDRTRKAAEAHGPGYVLM